MPILETIATSNSWRFLVDAIRKTSVLRRKLAKASHAFFFLMYLPKYMRHGTAAFQREIFKLTEDEKIKLCVISAFRGSAKSTICTVSGCLWQIVSGRAHFVVIISQTLPQVRHHLASIATVIESNPRLRDDLGQFTTEDDEKGAFSMTFKKYNAKIIAVSVGQNIRGIHYNEYRPDYIVLDDVEDTNSVKTKEGRDKTYEWFESDVMPVGEEKTRIFLLGTPLHEDSLLMQLIKQISEGRRDGVVRTYPFLDDEGKALWPERYPTMEDIERMRRTIVNDVFWEREYMLRIVRGDDQIFRREWIQYYDDLPNKNDPKTEFRMSVIAVDPASKTGGAHDYTAMVGAH